MTPWIYGLGGTAIVAALAGWTVRDWKADSDQLKAEKAFQEAYQYQTELWADSSFQYEILVQQIRADERTDRTTIREIYRDVEVPTQCAAPAGAVSVLNNAVKRANAAATGKPIGSVSSPAKPADPPD